MPDGFELVVTKPVEPVSAVAPDSYAMHNYTYRYSNAYGSPEIDTQPNSIINVAVSDDRRSVYLKVEGLRPLYIHELRAEGVRSVANEPLRHPDAYYTLNQLPAN